MRKVNYVLLTDTNCDIPAQLFQIRIWKLKVSEIPWSVWVEKPLNDFDIIKS